MITSLRLVDGSRTLTLLPHPDITVTAVNFGFPEVRALSEGRTDDDGERDDTELFGARAVSLSLQLYGTPGALADQVKAFCAPRSRPWLHVIDSEWTGERRLRLRAEQVGDPIEEGADDVLRVLQVQWRAPDGVWEATELTTVTITAESTTLTGRTMPVSFPVGWPATEAAGITQIVHAGPVPLHWVARLYGPCEGPRLTHGTAGQLAFRGGAGGLALAAGEYVEVDSRGRTAYHLSDPAASRLNTLDFATSDWWQLAPGTNQVRYNPALVSGAGCAAVIEYRPTWL